MAQFPDNDTYAYKMMLQEDDRNDFVKTMMKKIVDHKHWSIIYR